LKEKIETFKKDLLSLDKSLIVSQWLLEPCPYIFRDDYLFYLRWKTVLGKTINVDPKDIVVIGTAGLGFSLNPYKNYKSFDEKSDIDIAIISHYHFDIAWFELRHLGTKRLRLSPIELESINDHVNRLIYWGTIATDKILHLFPFNLEWQKATDEIKKMNAIFNRDINFRIYNDYDSLRAYNINNMKKLQDRLLEEMK
jgi:hypothetical protein